MLKTQRYIAKVFSTLFIMLNYDNCFDFVMLLAFKKEGWQ